MSKKAKNIKSKKRKAVEEENAPPDEDDIDVGLVEDDDEGTDKVVINKAPSKKSKSPLAGLVVMVAIKQKKLKDQCTEQLTALGADVISRYNQKTLTHLVFKEGGSTSALEKATAGKRKVVTPDWVAACHKEQAHTLEDEFLTSPPPPSQYDVELPLISTKNTKKKIPKAPKSKKAVGKKSNQGLAVFRAEQREVLEEKHPEMNAKALNKMITTNWQRLSAAEKKKYNDASSDAPAADEKKRKKSEAKKPETLPDEEEAEEEEDEEQSVKQAKKKKGVPTKKTPKAKAKPVKSSPAAGAKKSKQTPKAPAKRKSPKSAKSAGSKSGDNKGAKKKKKQRTTKSKAPQPMTVTFSGSQFDGAVWNPILQNLGIESADNVDECTHVVIDENKVTLKVLSALSRGLWIVKSSFILSGLEGKLPAEGAHECSDWFPGAPASRKGAAPGGTPVFHGVSVHVTSRTGSRQKNSLVELLTEGGATLIAAADADYVIAQTTTEGHEEKTVTTEWIIDSLVNYEIQPRGDYIPK